MQLRFDGLIGTGGIGSGRFFALDGDHTLGREESRSGRFLDRRDYCKLHIVTHYVQTLLGPRFTTLPIGRIGDDDSGARLLEEMATAGLDTHHVASGPGEQTMFALCFLYPDGSGGNLTVNDSASSHVTPEAIRAAEIDFARMAGRGIALALPEVPLPARAELLALGSAFGFFRVASYTTSEIHELRGTISPVDFLALNLDEASALAGCPVDGAIPEVIVKAAVARAGAGTWLTVTAGALGSWSWDGAVLSHLPAAPVRVVGTAGAGDAHLAGTLVGLAIGLPFGEAHHLGVLVAAAALTSPHTINDRLDRAGLLACAAETGLRLPNLVRDFLSGAGI